MAAIEQVYSPPKADDKSTDVVDHDDEYYM